MRRAFGPGRPSYKGNNHAPAPLCPLGTRRDGRPYSRWGRRACSGYVGAHFVEGFGFTTQAVDLGPAGDAGLDLVAQHGAFDEFAVLLVVGNGVRARANHAHAAL